jgi:hypothetical protein
MRLLGRGGLTVLGIAVLYFPGMAFGGIAAGVPEIDAGSAVSAIVLALGSLAVLRHRLRRK